MNKNRVIISIVYIMLENKISLEKLTEFFKAKKIEITEQKARNTFWRKLSKEIEDVLEGKK